MECFSTSNLATPECQTMPLLKKSTLLDKNLEIWRLLDLRENFWKRCFNRQVGFNLRERLCCCTLTLHLKYKCTNKRLQAKEHCAEKLSPGFTFTLSLCQSTTIQPLFLANLVRLMNQVQSKLCRINFFFELQLFTYELNFF